MPALLADRNLVGKTAFFTVRAWVRSTLSTQGIRVIAGMGRRGPNGKARE